jgi:dGTPase
MHCRAYSRYIDKTQVFFLLENAHITRRVLHVQFVSKIGRTIARCLKANEDLVEAIALAHDLGHAPFGHAGEEFLGQMLQDRGGGTFIHNAHSVRILDVLENEGQGLNLTLQVLDGVLGHNGEIVDQELIPSSGLDWETLDGNCNRCLLEPGADRSVYPSTLEGCIVRVADLISYIGRDIEDAIELYVIKRGDLPKDATDLLGDSNRDIIHNLVMDVIHNSYQEGKIAFSEEVFTALQELKKFNYERIYLSDTIKVEKTKLREVFSRMFDLYIDDLVNENRASLIYTEHVRYLGDEYLSQNVPARVATDFIASMTDDFLLEQFRVKFVPQNLGYRLHPSNASAKPIPVTGSIGQKEDPERTCQGAGKLYHLWAGQSVPLE